MHDNEYSEKGRHVLCDVWGVDFGRLNTVDALAEVMIQGAIKSRATILHVHKEKFVPSGCTVVLVLAESHFTIHTYPHKGFAAIDCYTCGDTCDPQVAVTHLVTYLEPSYLDLKTEKRGEQGRLTSS